MVKWGSMRKVPQLVGGKAWHFLLSKQKFGVHSSFTVLYSVSFFNTKDQSFHIHSHGESAGASSRFVASHRPHSSSTAKIFLI